MIFHLNVIFYSTLETIQWYYREYTPYKLYQYVWICMFYYSNLINIPHILQLGSLITLKMYEHDHIQFLINYNINH